MEKKYQLIESDQEGLFRIKALRSFNDVKEGDLGGYVASEDNLSHEGDCWVYHYAVVKDNARVSDNARVGDYAQVTDNALVDNSAQIMTYARVSDNAWVSGHAMVGGTAKISGHAKVMDNATITDNAHVTDKARVFGEARAYNNSMVGGTTRIGDNAQLQGNAQIMDNAWVGDSAMVGQNAKVFGNAQIQNNARIYGNAQIYDNAIIRGEAAVEGNAKVCLQVILDDETWVVGDAEITSAGDVIYFRNFWSSQRGITWTRSNNMWKTGCFYGTGEELVKKAYSDSKGKGIFYEAYVKFVENLNNLMSACPYKVGSTVRCETETKMHDGVVVSIGFDHDGNRDLTIKLNGTGDCVLFVIDYDGNPVDKDTRITLLEHGTK